MTESVLFHEVQRFNQGWLWGIFGISGMLSIGVTVFALHAKGLLGAPFPSAYHIPLIILVVAFTGVGLLLYSSRLETDVTAEGLSVRFFPLELTPRRIPWTEVADHKAVAVSPMADFGGWGLRHGAKGRAYLASGNQTVAVTLTNGSTLYVGSQQAGELESAVGTARRRL